jgi:hypothetical protein
MQQWVVVAVLHLQHSECTIRIFHPRKCCSLSKTLIDMIIALLTSNGRVVVVVAAIGKGRGASSASNDSEGETVVENLDMDLSLGLLRGKSVSVSFKGGIMKVGGKQHRCNN